MWVPFPSMTPVTFVPLAEHGMIPMFPEEEHDKTHCSGFCSDTTALDSIASDSSSDNGTARSQEASQESSDDEDVALEWAVSVKNTFITVPVDDPSFPRCSRHRRRSVPAHLGSRKTSC